MVLVPYSFSSIRLKYPEIALIAWEQGALVQGMSLGV